MLIIGFSLLIWVELECGDASIFAFRLDKKKESTAVKRYEVLYY